MFSWFKKQEEPVIKPKRKNKRAYVAAGKGRMFSGWATPDISINAEMRKNYHLLRARSNWLARNNPHLRRATKQMVASLIGQKGPVITFYSEKGAREGRRKRIGEAWEDWFNSREMDAQRRKKGIVFLRLLVRTWYSSGEAIVMRVIDPSAPFGLRLRLMEGAYINHRKNEDLPNGNRVVMGVELDGGSQPVAYHIYERHPSERTAGSHAGRTNRVPADEIIHVFHEETAEQGRGVPPGVSVISHLKWLWDFQFARVAAQQANACLTGVFTDENERPTIDDEDEAAGAGDEVPDTFEPLMVLHCAQGQKFETHQPPQVHGQSEFVSDELKAIASGAGVSHLELSQDFKDANYSIAKIDQGSQRKLTAEDFDAIVAYFLERVFEWFTETLRMMGKATEGVTMEIERAPATVIDPKKDTEAVATQVKEKFISRSAGVRAFGNNPEKVDRERLADKKREEELGLSEVSLEK